MLVSLLSTRPHQLEVLESRHVIPIDTLRKSHSMLLLFTNIVILTATLALTSLLHDL